MRQYDETAGPRDVLALNDQLLGVLHFVDVLPNNPGAFHGEDHGIV